MVRPLRLELEGALYHLTGRGNERQSIFRREGDCETFLALVGESLGRYGVRLHGYVLMGNHYHLLAETSRANLSRWMHWLVTSYTVGHNRRHRRVGHLFQGRYQSILVEADSYLLELSRYLHLNPVRGRMLGEGELKERRKRLREWPWSSYRSYAGLKKPGAMLTEELVLGTLGGGRKGRRARYRRFVEEGLLEPGVSPLAEARWGAVLGSESFQQRVLDRVGAWCEGGQREIKGLKTKVHGGRTIEGVAAAVGRAYGMSAAEVLNQRGRLQEAKGVTLSVAWDVCGVTLRELGERAGGMDYAAVAQQIRRTQRRAEERKLRVNLDELKAKCQGV